MPEQFVKIEGLSELEDALKELPKATGKNVIRRALLQAAEPIEDEANLKIRVKKVAPAVLTAKVKFSSGDAGKRAFAEALARGASRGEAGQSAREANRSGGGDDSGAGDTTAGVTSVGPTKRAFYGFEFGTVHQSPQPFMRPAWDGHKQQALDIIRIALAEEIEKARKRIAAKQAKLLAKI